MPRRPRRASLRRKTIQKAAASNLQADGVDPQVGPIDSSGRSWRGFTRSSIPSHKHLAHRPHAHFVGKLIACSLGIAPLSKGPASDKLRADQPGERCPSAGAGTDRPVTLREMGDAAGCGLKRQAIQGGLPLVLQKVVPIRHARLGRIRLIWHQFSQPLHDPGGARSNVDGSD